MDRCDAHDDLVIAIGRVSAQLDEVHDDIKEIKDINYKICDGGVVGWMHRVKGQLKVIGVVLSTLSVIVSGIVAGVVIAWVRTFI